MISTGSGDFTGVGNLPPPENTRYTGTARIPEGLKDGVMFSFQAGSDASKRTSLSETHLAYVVGYLPDIIGKNDSKVVHFGHQLGSESGQQSDDHEYNPKAWPPTCLNIRDCLAAHGLVRRSRGSCGHGGLRVKRRTPS